MYEELLKEVQAGLAARKGEWQQLAETLKADAQPGDVEVSYSFISQVGRGVYASKPQFQRLERVARLLRARAVPLA